VCERVCVRDRERLREGAYTRPPAEGRSPSACRVSGPASVSCTGARFECPQCLPSEHTRDMSSWPALVCYHESLAPAEMEPATSLGSHTSRGLATRTYHLLAQQVFPVPGLDQSSLTYTRSLSHAHCLPLTHALSLTLSLSHTRSLSLTHSLTLSLTHTLFLTHTLSLTHALFYIHTLSLSHTHALSSTHTLSLWQGVRDPCQKQGPNSSARTGVNAGPLCGSPGCPPMLGAFKPCMTSRPCHVALPSGSCLEMQAHLEMGFISIKMNQ